MNLLNKKYWILLVGLLSIVGLSSSVSKENAVNQQEYLIYASLMNHFAVHTQWPAAKRSGNFVIGVIGSSPIETELKKLAASKKVAGRSIVIKRFKSDEDLAGCHMVFVPKAKLSQLTKITSKSKTMNALVVAEGSSNNSFVFNFVKKDGKPRFEFNKSVASSHGLVVSPNLVKLSIPVN